MTISIRPPFTLETALAKVRAAEDAWNSRDPARVSLAYSVDSVLAREPRSRLEQAAAARSRSSWRGNGEGNWTTGW